MKWVIQVEVRDIRKDGVIQDWWEVLCGLKEAAYRAQLPGGGLDEEWWESRLE